MTETTKNGVQLLVGLSKEARQELDRVRDPKCNLKYPDVQLSHELMVSGLVCRTVDDIWALSPHGLAVITHAKAFGDVTAQYYALPGVCRRILQTMLDGRVNVDPYLPASLRSSGFIKDTGLGWVVTDLANQLSIAKEV